MKIAFRADASVNLGSGHVMRCLTLAQELKAQGCRIVFICTDLPGHLCELLEQRGMAVCRLPAPANGETPGWRRDAEATTDAIRRTEGTVDWMVVDHYDLDARWEFALRGVAAKVMAIDDQANRSHDCNLLLDQNDYPDMETRYDRLVAGDCQRLLGPHYALLRPEFETVREAMGAALQRDGRVRRILLSFGGTDSPNLTEMALDAIDLLGRGDIAVDAVIGQSHPYRQELIARCSESARTALHVQSSNMANLMAAADLAIGGGGATNWERCALGLPAMLISLADNQTPICRGLAVKQAAIFLGEYRELAADRLSQALRAALADPAALAAMSENCIRLVDAKGCRRVAARMRA